MAKSTESKSKPLEFRQTAHLPAQPERWRGNQLWQLVEGNLRKSEQIERKVNLLSGAAAHSFASRIFRNHHEQFKQEGNKELACPLPESLTDLGTFSEVVILDEKYPGKISLEARMQGSYTERKEVTLPIYLRDKTYVFKTSAGRVFVVYDHEDSFLPHEAMYQAIKKEKVEPYEVFSQLLRYFSMAGKNSHRLLAEHQRMAESVGLDLGIKKNHKSYRGQARIHIYMAGHQPKKDAFSEDLLVVAALRQGFKIEQTFEDPQEAADSKKQLWQQFWAGLQGDSALRLLLRMDINYLPGLYSSEGVKKLVARVALAHALGRSNSIQESVPLPQQLDFSPKVIADYITHLLYLESWDEVRSLDELFFSTSVSKRVKQIALGLLSAYDQLGFTSTDESLDFLLQNEQITFQEKTELKNCIDLEQQIASFPSIREKQAISNRAASFLGVYGVNEDLFSTTSSLAHRLDVDALGSPRTHLLAKRGGAFSSFGLRLNQLMQPLLDHFPQYEYRVKNNRSFTRTRTTPFWSMLFGHELELSYKHDLPALQKMLIEFHSALQVLQGYELIPSEMAATIVNFWHSIIGSLDLSPDPKLSAQKQAETVFKALESKTTGSKLSSHGYATEQLKGWLFSSAFLERVRYFWEKIRANGYSLVAHQENGPTHGGLLNSAKNLPLHLVTDRTVRFNKALINLELYLNKAKDLGKHSCEHIAVRMAALHQHPGAVHCRDHRYEDNYSKTVWFQWGASKFTKTWVAEHWQELVGDAEQVNTYPDNNAALVGEKIYNLINPEIEALLAQAAVENNQARRVRILYQAYRLATVVYELDRTWEKPSAGERVHFGISAWSDNYNQIRKSLREMIDVASKEKVKPPGAIEMKPGQIHCLLGPNMGGKSTVMRQIGFNILAHNQGLPQVGGSFSVAPDIFLSSPVGSERQMVGESLFTQGAKDLGDIISAKQGEGEKHLWMLDEFGRRTNARYGQANMMTAGIIAAAFAKQPKDMALMATHYQSMVHYQPFFKALGLELVFWKVEDFKLKRLEPGEEVRSLAIQAIAKHLPVGAYLDWPDKKDIKLIKEADLSIERKSLKPLNKEQIAALTRDDLLGFSMENKIRFVYQRYNMSAAEAKIFLARYLVPEKAVEKQKVIAAVLEHPQLNKHLQVLRDCEKVVEFYEKIRKEHWMERSAMKRNFYQHSFPGKVDHKAAVEDFYKQESKFLRQLVKKTNATMNFAVKLMSQVSPGWFDDKVSEIKISHVLDGVLDKSFYELGAVFSYASQIKSKREMGFSYAQVEFTDEVIFAAEEAWNPNLQGKKIVTNSFNYDFNDGRAGVVTTGENGSGKSNHQITVGNLGMEAMCLGFGPAAKITANKNLQVLSLTQPVSDTRKESSMSQEVLRRIAKAVAVAKYSQDPTLVLLDEPGAPTSETDAHKIIVWLFRKFLNNSNTKIEVSTHCDGLVDALKDIAHFQAFRLLSEQPYKAFVGTADSNALEVGKAYGMDETFYDIAKIVYEFIVLTQADKDLIKKHAQAFAERIKEILAQRVFAV